ncbi:hypothetical protein HYH03_007827 [Edaphochlamys debaryana]|uniref:HECT domain-containing protein n=1 Tax=Edaphochlamys debaryana TaxID=47281 RepID=A0A835Y165_9CHLO|nr:hypothetical protein HYH03_007827 [Edaphochlamys debaryana]|eukprot:KAG2493890.1 hypothetical protein HYH03_007827 [Edaphochlamys debaryana]
MKLEDSAPAAAPPSMKPKDSGPAAAPPRGGSSPAAKAGPGSPAPARASPPPPTPSLSALVRPGVRLVAWGRCDWGQLGLGLGPQASGGVAVPRATPVEALSGKDVVGVAGGPFHSAFVTADGELYTAGCNDNCQLGRKALAGPPAAGAASGGGSGGSSAWLPGHVTALEAYGVAAAGCGATHTMALTEQGLVVAWGGNEFGQTGSGAEGPDQAHPRPVKGMGEQRVVRLAVGSNHALMLTGGGGVFAVGQGSFGALGLGPTALDNRSVPVPIPPLMPLGVLQVAAGETHSAALTADGRLFTWGRGKYGQLGHGDWANRPGPHAVAALRGLRATQVACGDDHTLVITAPGPSAAPAPASASASASRGEGAGGGGGGGGVVYSFGRGTWGATGLGATDNTCRPARVPALANEPVVQVAAGARHSLALTASHVVYGFGNDDFGQLGLGVGRPQSALSASASEATPGSTVHPSPRRVAALPSGRPVLALAAAGDASMVLLQEAPRPGEVVPAGPRPGRRQGAYDMPYVLPDLGRLAAAAATASEDPRALRDLASAIEEVLSSPGYVLALFSAATDNPHQLHGFPYAPTAAASDGGSGPASAKGSSSCSPVATPVAGTPPAASRHDSPARARSGGAAAAGGPAHLIPHGMDAGAIQVCFEALMRLYKPEVVAAMGNSLVRLLDAVLTAIPPPPGAAQAGARNGGSAGGAADGTSATSTTGGLLWADTMHASSSSSGGGAGSSGGAVGVVSAAALAPVLRVLFVVWQCPLLAGAGSGVSVGQSLSYRLITATLKLPHDAQTLLSDWLASLPPEVFGGRVVRPLQTALGALAEAEAAAVEAAGALAGGPGAWAAREQEAAARSGTLGAARVLAALHEANERVGAGWAGCPLPYTEFHNAAASQAANLKAEYILWLQAGHGKKLVSPARKAARDPGALLRPEEPLVSLCQVPFLLTPDAKSRILQGEANIQKEAEMSASAQEALMQGLHPGHALFLDIHVRRGPHLLADAAQQLAGRPPHHLKRPLRVSFVSQGVTEEGVDQGGVSREFFQLLTAEIFNPQYGLFTYSDETRTYWFNVAALPDSAPEYRLVGALLGLAIYNGVILDVHLPQVVYKKLLREAVGLGDLAEAFPTLGRSLQAVLDMDPGAVEDALCRSFEVEYDYFGERRTVPLIPNGSSTPVTGANVGRYVSRLVEWTLGEGVEAQFDAFASGFYQVCGGPALSLFRHEELELLVCGLPHLDFGALQANARYEGGYHARHPTVLAFWQVLSELDLDAKRRLLAFSTGCDRAPVAGLGALVFTLQRSGPDTDRLPTAHTCFNTLMLPEYASRAKLKAKLLLAIDNAQGFGLK